MDKLAALGFGDWFNNRLDQAMAARHEIARVISVHKDRFTLNKGAADTVAELSGNLLYRTDSAVDLPTVGDWVYADFFDEDSHAIIHGLLPRKTLLKRKTAGKAIDFQLIAANLDTAFIIQSLNENFNLRRLERYLVIVNDSGIEPVVLLSKSDLLTSGEIDAIKAMVEEITPGTHIIEFSTLSGDRLQSILQSLRRGATYCLLGSSGVGKTTLLNSIIGHHAYQTRTVSKTESKGRHTTTQRQLVRVQGGAMIIDTPGMRELGSLFVDDGLDATFSDIGVLSQNCRFANCSHTREEDCAVRTAITAGDLSEQRYQNYLKMKRESEFNQMSYVEKRQRDKNFGKMVKSVMKTKKRQ